MYPHSNEEGNQLLGQRKLGKRQQQKVGGELTETPYKIRQSGNNNDVIKSICYMTIFAVLAGVALVQILSTSAFSQGGFNSNQNQQISEQVKSNPEARKQQVRQQRVEPGDQDFAIQIQQKPHPSSPSQVPLQLLSTPQPPSSNPWLQQIPSSSKDKYFLKVPVKKMLQLSSPEKFFGKSLSRQMSGMSFDQLQFGLNLLYVVHNIKFNGQISIELAPYESDKKQKQEWIRKLLQAQKSIYQQKYDISQYMSPDMQLPFCIITPSYNNVQSKLYLRNLDSIFMQQYSNYHVVYIDDASTDKTGQWVLKYAQERGIPKDKLKVVVNQKNVFALENIYNAIYNYCENGQVVMLIDGDDALIGRQVFTLYNAIYQRTESALVYSNYLEVMYNEKAVIGASSRAIPPQLLQRHGGIRNQHAFFTSHLLSFYVDLFKMIKKQDLTYQNGTFYKYAYDVAMCTPMIEMASDRIFYVPELTYEYRFDTGHNDPASGQQQVTSIIFEKPVYQQLKQFPFIDDRENYLKDVQKEKNF